MGGGSGESGMTLAKDKRRGRSKLITVSPSQLWVNVITSLLLIRGGGSSGPGNDPLKYPVKNRFRIESLGCLIPNQISKTLRLGPSLRICSVVTVTCMRVLSVSFLSYLLDSLVLCSFTILNWMIMNKFPLFPQ